VSYSKFNQIRLEMAWFATSVYRSPKARKQVYFRVAFLCGQCFIYVTLGPTNLSYSHISEPIPSVIFCDLQTTSGSELARFSNFRPLQRPLADEFRNPPEQKVLELSPVLTYRISLKSHFRKSNFSNVPPAPSL